MSFASSWAVGDVNSYFYVVCFAFDRIGRAFTSETWWRGSWWFKHRSSGQPRSVNVRGFIGSSSKYAELIITSPWHMYLYLMSIELRNFGVQSESMWYTPALPCTPPIIGHLSILTLHKSDITCTTHVNVTIEYPQRALLDQSRARSYRVGYINAWAKRRMDGWMHEVKGHVRLVYWGVKGA